MTPTTRLILIVAGLPLLAGCISTDPRPAFDDVRSTVVARTGHETRWWESDDDRRQIEAAVTMMLGTNLTADTAVAIALLNNRALHADFEEIGISQADLSAASRLRNPEFDGMWRLPNTGPQSVNADYGIMQNLLDLVTLPARKTIARGNLEAAKLGIAHRVMMLAEETRVAFYTVVAARQLTNRLGVIAEVNDAAADVARRQHAVGNINDLELQLHEVALAQSRLDLARAQLEVRSGREAVNRLLGLWGTQTSWEPDDASLTLPAADPSLDHVEKIAVRHRLDLAAARAEVLNFQRALKLRKSVRWLPGASLGFNAERELDGTWLLGPALSLEVPIFDQGQPEIARLDAEYRRAARQLEGLAIQIRSEVREARDTLIAARDVAEFHQQVLLPRRMRILRETLLHYNAMQKGNTDLLLAKEQEQQAEQAAIEATRDYWIARARLQSALGGSLSPESLSEAADQSAAATLDPSTHHHPEH